MTVDGVLVASTSCCIGVDILLDCLTSPIKARQADCSAVSPALQAMLLGQPLIQSPLLPVCIPTLRTLAAIRIIRFSKLAMSQQVKAVPRDENA